MNLLSINESLTYVVRTHAVQYIILYTVLYHLYHSDDVLVRHHYMTY
jgi:hypothetical protein